VIESAVDDGGDNALLKRNYYLTLGLRMNDQDNGLRHAFYALVKHYHPDSVGANGTPFYQEIVEAYHVLSDSDRRDDYARGLSDAGATATREPAWPLPDFNSPRDSRLPTTTRFLSNSRMSWPSLDLVREQVLKNFLHGEPPQQKRTEAIDAQLTLTPEEAARGGIAMIEAPAIYPCPACQGSGQEDGFPCPVCDELGVVEEKESIPVEIPAMLEPRQQIEIPLRGLGIHNFYLRLHLNVAPR
jgi:DnaJ-class molecular chaperone